MQFGQLVYLATAWGSVVLFMSYVHSSLRIALATLVSWLGCKRQSLAFLVITREQIFQCKWQSFKMLFLHRTDTPITTLQGVAALEVNWVRHWGISECQWPQYVLSWAMFTPRWCTTPLGWDFVARMFLDEWTSTSSSSCCQHWRLTFARETIVTTVKQYVSLHT